MSLTRRLLAAIWVSTLVVLAASTFLQIQEERGRLVSDLERRAGLLAEGLKDALEPVVSRGSPPGIERLLNQPGKPHRGIAVYDQFGRLIAATPDLVPLLPPSVPEVTAAITQDVVQKGFGRLGERKALVYATPLHREHQAPGALAVVLDATHLEAAEWALWRDSAVRFLALAIVVSLITLVIVKITVTRPIVKMAQWTKALQTGRPVAPPDAGDVSLFGPLAFEVSGLAKSLNRAQAAAEQEALLRLQGESTWTEERLKQFVNQHLGGRPIVVVSNRQPVSHVRIDGQIRAQRPASGLVTALEPVMRACGGVWVAHGSGDSDRIVADPGGRVGLPEDNPRYTLRRVWLSSEEQDGHYHGFANEGLWPLCHIVHTRPVFRPGDWAHYLGVNRKFAATVLEELQGAEEPLVLIQDYHFAILPALIKEARPDARVGIFWHIPWPNPESFSICPWQEELLLGMLGADLIGFHTQYHCNNFLETVERAIEARIDWEHFSVSRGQRTTHVKPFPISVVPEFVEEPPVTSRETILDTLGISPEFLGLGVERVDYTKGLPERFRALHRFFERYPEYRERVVFVQLAAPSRSRIKRYQELEAEVEETVQTVNGALGTKRWQPILYLRRHHEHREIWPFYHHADFLMVTSLHDGMNLVAKEFVSTRDDDGGVLILSRFTGASCELRDALLVNPYDLDQMAEAIRIALEMPLAERKSRMARMRQTVREHNIYRWAGLLLHAIAITRLPSPAPSVTSNRTRLPLTRSRSALARALGRASECDASRARGSPVTITSGVQPSPPSAVRP